MRIRRRVDSPRSPDNINTLTLASENYGVALVLGSSFEELSEFEPMSKRL